MQPHKLMKVPEIPVEYEDGKQKKLISKFYRAASAGENKLTAHKLKQPVTLSDGGTSAGHGHLGIFNMHVIKVSGLVVGDEEVRLCRP